MLLFSTITFIVAYTLQIEALILLPVLAIYIIYCKKEIITNPYFRYACTAFFGLAVFFYISGKNPLKSFFFDAPIWGQQSVFFYALLPENRIMLFLVFIGIIVSIILWKIGAFKNKSINIYILLNLFIPFFILSIYPWKSARYSLFVFPFLVLCASNVIDLYIIQNVIDKNVCAQISNRFKLKIEILKNIKFVIIFIISALLLLQIVSSIDAFYISQKDHGSFQSGIIHSNWKKGGDYIKDRLIENDKIMTTLTLGSLYYIGHADYYIKQSEIDSSINTDGHLIDRLGGVEILNTNDSFMQIINNNKGWVITDYKIGICLA